jgi:hypothetical protein
MAVGAWSYWLERRASVRAGLHGKRLTGLERLHYKVSVVEAA